MNWDRVTGIESTHGNDFVAVIVGSKLRGFQT
jgi:hypothetical protein